MKKITIILGFLLAQNTIAFFPMPNMPKLPELPMFGDFNPNQLRTNFNKFSNSEPDFARERRVISQIEEAVMDGDVEYLPLKEVEKFLQFIWKVKQTSQKAVLLFCTIADNMQIGTIPSNHYAQG
ncbi:MAG: hypothetical protein H0A76_02880 [Candidatus Thiodubiliella endoseptemdiera]|uniref:Uncharacterized protein n=1 Tax=Candidatus Thiodubiliella endoseptemdiera TaxID=2738886 RepID=A0A853EZF1_9GAMM|nr:hypothetical protein [Candidatus Thiodubiliella endoseptemdiera]